MSAPTATTVPAADRCRCLFADQPDRRPHCELTAVISYGQLRLCADCDARRSTLGKGSPRRLLAEDGPFDVLDWIGAAQARQRAASAELAAAVARARARGHSWSDIGARLHITRQAAQQRFAPPSPPRRQQHVDTPRPDAPVSAVLSQTDATELADLLELLEDWLTHASGETHDELGEFLNYGSVVGNNDQYRVRQMIDRLGEHSVTLTRQLTGNDATGAGHE